MPYILPINSICIYGIYSIPGPMLGARDKTVNEVDITSFPYEELSIGRKKNIQQIINGKLIMKNEVQVTATGIFDVDRDLVGRERQKKRGS